MANYIDADKLLGEIARLREEHTTKEYRDEAALVLDDLEDYVDSLQQEQQEVDLEEITKFSRIKDLPDGFDKDWLKYYHTDKEYSSVKFHHLSALEREYIIARHFYELGKNSK